MSALNPYILTILTAVPLVGVLCLLFVDKEKADTIRATALGFAVADFLFSLHLFFHFQLGEPGMQFVARVPWIPPLHIDYYVGLDGISLFLVLLTTLLTPICILSSFSSIRDRVKEYMICFLLLETAMIGVFVSLDLILFYIFWEIMLIPMALLIGVWGGQRRIYAAIKFFLYTMVGSMLMLVAIISLHVLSKDTTFALPELQKMGVPYNYQVWCFLAFGLAFAIKVPMFPLHTWLPDAHTEAPTAGSVILAGVLLKMGTYGFLRFCIPLFPAASIQFMPLLAVLAIIGIIYGAAVALVQRDVKKLVAYSSVSHLGFVMLGIFVFNVQGMQGGLLQMINHGLSTGALFLLVGILYERRHTRQIADFGGIWKVMPTYGVLFLITLFASIGLPGLNGFVGEFLVLVGTMRHSTLYAALATTGVILSAIYMLWMFQRVMHGELDKEENKKLSDVRPVEILTLAPLVAAMFWIGLYPGPILTRTEPAVKQVLSYVQMDQHIAGRRGAVREARLWEDR